MVKIVLTTTDSEETAKKIAKKAVKDHKAACVNIIRNVSSFYYWKDELQEDAEFLLLIKTEDSRLEELIELLKGIHNYDLPELLWVEDVKGSPDYTDWIRASCI